MCATREGMVYLCVTKESVGIYKKKGWCMCVVTREGMVYVCVYVCDVCVQQEKGWCMCVTREGMVYVCNKRRDGVCV